MLFVLSFRFRFLPFIFFSRGRKGGIACFAYATLRGPERDIRGKNEVLATLYRNGIQVAF